MSTTCAAWPCPLMTATCSPALPTTRCVCDGDLPGARCMHARCSAFTIVQSKPPQLCLCVCDAVAGTAQRTVHVAALQTCLFQHQCVATLCPVRAPSVLLACAWQVRIWDVALMVHPGAVAQRHAAEVTHLAVATSGAFVATASKDNATGVWALPRLRPSTASDAGSPRPLQAARSEVDTVRSAAAAFGSCDCGLWGGPGLCAVRRGGLTKVCQRRCAQARVCPWASCRAIRLAMHGAALLLGAAACPSVPARYRLRTRLRPSGPRPLTCRRRPAAASPLHTVRRPCGQRWGGHSRCRWQLGQRYCRAADVPQGGQAGGVVGGHLP